MDALVGNVLKDEESAFNAEQLLGDYKRRRSGTWQDFLDGQKEEVKLIVEFVRWIESSNFTKNSETCTHIVDAMMSRLLSGGSAADADATHELRDCEMVKFALSRNILLLCLKTFNCFAFHSVISTQFSGSVAGCWRFKVKAGSQEIQFRPGLTFLFYLLSCGWAQETEELEARETRCKEEELRLSARGKSLANQAEELKEWQERLEERDRLVKSAEESLDRQKEIFDDLMEQRVTEITRKDLQLSRMTMEVAKALDEYKQRQKSLSHRMPRRSKRIEARKKAFKK